MTQMAAIIRNNRPEDWPDLEDIILNAENFGPEFLQYEELRISVSNLEQYRRCLHPRASA